MQNLQKAVARDTYIMEGCRERLIKGNGKGEGVRGHGGGQKHRFLLAAARMRDGYLDIGDITPATLLGPAILSVWKQAAARMPVTDDLFQDGIVETPEAAELNL